MSITSSLFLWIAQNYKQENANVKSGTNWGQKKLWEKNQIWRLQRMWINTGFMENGQHRRRIHKPAFQIGIL